MEEQKISDNSNKANNSNFEGAETHETGKLTNIEQAFKTGKKVGFINGFMKATSIISSNIEKMQESILKATKGGGK